MDKLRYVRWFLAAAAVIAVAAFAAWWASGQDMDQIARVAFRDEVIGVIGSRFARGAVAVPGNPGAIDFVETRRDIRPLYDASHLLPETERRQRIYLWFLGDPATARGVVREQQFPPQTAPAEPVKPLLEDLPPKRVKTLSVRPNGSIVEPRR